VKDKSKLILIASAGAAAAVMLGLFRSSNLEPKSFREPLIVSARPKPDTPPTPSPSTTRTGNSPALPSTAPAQLAPDTPRSPLAFGDEFGQADAPEAFRKFAAWCERYRAARSNEERSSLESEGRQLAQERRAALASLIRDNPELALSLAVPFEVRQTLPASFLELFEQNVSGMGTLAVFGALAEPGKEAEVTPVFRTASIGEEQYDAFVYGRRLGEPTRRNIPLNGIAVGGLLALSANPLRVLSAAEAHQNSVASDPVCAISGQPATIHNTPTTAEVGGRKLRLCGLGHADEMNARLIHAEAAGGGSGGEVAGDEVQASAYTEGTKRLLVMRVDFPDLPGDPFPTNTGVNLISGLNDFYLESSYGRTGFYLNGSGSSITPTLHLTNSASFYGTNNYYARLQNDARAAASAAGYNVSSYDFDLTCFGPVPGWSWAGLGWIGANGVWLRNYFTAGVAGHELGHNYGLNHANYWDTGGASIIGTNGTSVEYGDSFDTMGSANAGANHFNARYKSYLNWLRTGEVQTVSSSGTYRIYAHDDTNAMGIRALKVIRNSNTNYWVEFRQKFTGNAWMMNGAGLRWAGNGNQRSDLLDTTPGSANGKNDSPLVVGRTFSDLTYGIHITTLRKAGTWPEALDVVVNLGTFPSNQRPSLNIAANSNSVAIGSPVALTASASDADGDTLAYYWDFGDGTFGTNGSIASKSWNASGEYRVQCTATDMKGGTASDSVLISVGSPTTYRISGTVTAAGAPVPGARVYVSSTRMAYTDSDGTYSIVGLPASSYVVNVSLNSYTFTPSGFSNPVNVGPSATGVNFTTSGFITVALTSPANNATFVNPSSVTLAATAAPAPGHSLVKVEFYQGTTKLGEDTTSPYSYNWVSPSAGSYSLTAVATDSGGLSAASSAVAIVISSGGPVITSQPQSVSVAPGATANFSVTASGAALAYLWRCNGTNVPGGTSPTLSLVNVQPSQAGSYQVVVSNSGGSVTSAVATLTVLQPPGIATQPQSQSVGVGANITFGVSATGSAPLIYQWRKNGSAIGGASSSSYQLTSVTLADAGDYSVIITNSAGSVTSAVATLTVWQSPVITAQPQSLTVAAGSNVTLAVTASGLAPLYYQWRKDGASIGGATASSLAFTPITPGDAADYSVVITNSVGAATSSIATVIVNCTVTLSTNSAAFNASGGNGNVNLNTYSACGWSITNVPAWITLASASSGSGNATVTYTVSTNSSGSPRAATLGIGNASYQVSQLPPDTTPPTVTISSPAADSTTTNSTLQVQGTASDNIGVARVEYRVGTNAFTVATGTTSWSALVSVTTGTNIVSVRSVDAAGNLSAEAQRPFVCIAPGTITVTVHGHGSVKGATNGQHLVFGKAYSLSATPAEGYTFSNWTGTVVGHTPRLDFVMMSNMQVTATFVPNPFAARKGVFTGLFYETNQVQQQRAGYFNLALTDKGSYSASLLTRGWKLKAKGKFDLTGCATNQIAAPDGSLYTVTWAVAMDGSDTIAGDVSASSWTASLLGDRLVFNSKTNPAPQAGRYTFVILGTPGQPDAPGGDGYGTITVATKGTALLSGHLADETKFIVKPPLSKAGLCPAYGSLYSGQGAILGWIAFRDRPTTDLDAVLSWARPSLPGSLYSGGFVSESAMIGSSFDAVPANTPALDLANPVIRFEGGNLSVSFTNLLAVTGGTFSNIGVNVNALSLKVTPSAGLFSGTVQVPGSSLTLPFNGAVVQKAGVGCGYFVGTNQTGRVTLESAP
jgi:hypothetical protein